MERLEREADRAAKIHIRKNLGNESHLPGYGFSGRGPKNYKRSDERILDDVCEALFRSYDVDASDMKVDVKDRVVILQGKVLDREMKRAAEDCVDSVRGVLDVRNELSFERNTSVGKRSISTPENEAGTRLS